MNKTDNKKELNVNILYNNARCIKCTKEAEFCHINTYCSEKCFNDSLKLNQPNHKQEVEVKVEVEEEKKEYTNHVLHYTNTSSSNMNDDIKSTDNEKYTTIVKDNSMEFAIENIEYGGNIETEIHTNKTQFIRIEKGDIQINIYHNDKVTLYQSYNLLSSSSSDHANNWIMIPFGTYHEVINIGKGIATFSTIYIPIC